MIELPRACIRADEIAEHADFFSFGTNDLTQTALGFSRDDAEGKFLTRYLEDGVLERNPFETLDQGGVGDLMRIAVERGRSVKDDMKMGICGEHGGEPESVAFCHASGSTTSPARRTASRSRASRRRRRRSKEVRHRGASTARTADRGLREALDARVGDEHACRARPRSGRDADAAPGGRRSRASRPNRESASMPRAPAGEAAEVAADGDVRDHEREHEVDDDQAERLPAENAAPLRLEDERSAEDPEDRAGRADGDGVRAEEQRAGRAGEPRDEVEREEAATADRLLDRGADDQSMSMFNPMWIRLACRNAAVISRHHSPSASPR